MLEALVILAVGIPAIVMDHRSRRIPNALVVAALAGALMVSALTGGAEAVLAAMLGAAVGFICLMPFYLLGAIGAGDVKFMAALGALLGPGGALVAFVAALFFGSVLALVMLGWWRIEELMASHGGESTWRQSAQRLPYAAAIVLGAVATALLQQRPV